MKNIFKYILLSGTLFIGITSCSSFLEEKVVSGVSYEYLESKKGMETAVNGVYSLMRAPIGNEWGFALLDYGVDYIWEGADGKNKDAFNKYANPLNATNGSLRNFWDNAYKGITRANTALAYLPKVKDMSDEEKRVFEGELRFLRSFYYFDLVQEYGAIPLVIDGNVSEIQTDFSRVPVATIYKQIINDSRIAYDALPDVFQQRDKGRATKHAAAALLAKVYLARGSGIIDQRGQLPSDMDSTIYYGEKVLNSGKFTLESDFAMLVDQDNHKVSTETIWSVQCTNDVLFNEKGNKLHLYWCPTYEKLPGMERDLLNGRAWKRLRVSPYTQTDLFDKINDSRYYKTFKLVFIANKASSIPTWKEKYYYIDENGKETNDLLYETPTALVGKPKFAIGDTAAYLIPKYYGAKNSSGKVIDKVKDRQMQQDIAKCSYTLIPVDNNTNHFYPQLKKWIDTQRPDYNYEEGSRDWIRLRLGDLYLDIAEAYGRKGDFKNAAKYINVIRQRAAYKEGEIKPQEWLLFDGGKAENITQSTEEAIKVTASDLSHDFIDFILDERARETYGEMNRWMTLVRTEKLVERVKKYNPDGARNIQEYHKLRPIPQSHIDRLNPKPPINEAQNEGYY